MLNPILTAAMTLATLVPAPGFKEAVKPPLSGGGTVIVKVLPHRVERADGAYATEEKPQDARARYEEKKKELDKRFAHMFELKASLDKQQSEMSAKWDEYYVLHEKYNKELKRIIASWVTDFDYTGEADNSVFPLPEARPYMRKSAPDNYEIEPQIPAVEK